MQSQDVLARLHTLAHYVHEGMRYTWSEETPGYGTGVGAGKLRLLIEVDAAPFWREFTMQEQRRRDIRRQRSRRGASSG